MGLDLSNPDNLRALEGVAQEALDLDHGGAMPKSVAGWVLDAVNHIREQNNRIHAFVADLLQVHADQVEPCGHEATTEALALLDKHGLRP